MKITKRPTVSAVYRILNLTNGKQYIGSSGDVLIRFSNHQKRLKNGVHSNADLQKDYELLGKKAFSYDIIEITPDRDWKERFLLERTDNSLLYNKLNINSYETYDNEEIINLGKSSFKKRIDCFRENHRLYNELYKRSLLDVTFDKIRIPTGKPKQHFVFFSDQTNDVYFNLLADDLKRNLENFHKSHPSLYQAIKIDAQDVETFKDQYRDLGYSLYERVNSRYRLIK
jgi:hypothetical protein